MHCNPTWLLGDHLGSPSMVADETGEVVSEVRYSAFGEIRYQSTQTLTTDYLYTGQRQRAEVGLYYYVARWYDPYLNRWTQPDTIIPDLESPQSWNRYSYVFNNPVKYNDPSGHCPWCVGAAVGALIGGAVGAVTYAITNDAENRTASGWATAIGGGAVGGALIGSGVGLISSAAAAVSTTAAGTAVVTGTTAMSAASSATVTTLIGAGTGALSSGTSYMFFNQNSYNPEDYLFTTTLGATSGAVSGGVSTLEAPLVQFGLNALNGSVTSNLQYIWDVSRAGEQISEKNIVVNSFYGGIVGGMDSFMPTIDGPGSLHWINTPTIAKTKAIGAALGNSLTTFLTTTGTTTLVEPAVKDLFME